MCAGREEILRRHIEKQGLPLGQDVTVEGIASSTTGFTGADLANLVNEAALLAGRSDKGNAMKVRSCQGVPADATAVCHLTRREQLVSPPSCAKLARLVLPAALLVGRSNKG